MAGGELLATEEGAVELGSAATSASFLRHQFCLGPLRGTRGNSARRGSHSRRLSLSAHPSLLFQPLCKPADASKASTLPCLILKYHAKLHVSITTSTSASKRKHTHITLSLKIKF